MKKLNLCIPLVLISLFSFSQDVLPNNFSIGNLLEIFGKDSMKIYFRCPGNLVDRQFATFYRVGKMDTEIINVTGEFHDYYTSNELYLSATMKDNYLEGPARYYYKNGRIKEEGRYQHSKRTGKWMYYYPDGKLKKIYDYQGDEPLVMEAFTPSGEHTVVNGNGKFVTIFGPGKQCIEYEIFGDLVNGKKQGKWTWLNNYDLGNWESEVHSKYMRQDIAYLQKGNILSTETFEDGKFISKNLSYQQIVFDNLYPSENVRLMESHRSISRPGQASSIHYARTIYHKSFYPELQQKLSNYTGSPGNQWLVVGISLSKKSKITSINVASSIDDRKLEKYAYQIIAGMTDWQTATSHSNKVPSDLFFSILVDSGEIIIPAIFVHQY